MLVLSRKDGETILVGDDIEIQILDIKKGSVKIGISAPRNVAVDREEVRIRKIQDGIINKNR